MAHNFPQPTQSNFKSFSVNGANLLPHLNKMSVYESMFKPYITARVNLMDSTNLINNLGLVGGMPVTFSFDDGNETNSYDMILHIHNIHGEKSNQSARTKMYTMDLIGPEYYSDKKQIVQQSFKNIPSTSAVQKLHSAFIGGDLRVLAQSMGPISKMAHVVKSKKPFTAINEIMAKMNFGQYPTGNPMYFRDKVGHVLGPMEALFDQLSPQTQLIEKTTWGADFTDIFTATNAIISATAEVDFSKNGRSGAADVAGAAHQGKTVFDYETKKVVVDKLARKIGAGKLVGKAATMGQDFIGFASKLGGAPNFWAMDAAHAPASTDQSSKTEQERLYGALVKNGPCMTIRCPIQSGILCTVGKGVDLKLLPPMGDSPQGQVEQTSGLYLITDICHEIFLDDRRCSGTTIFQAVRGGCD